MNNRDHVQQGFNAVMGVLRLVKVYSPERVEKACQRAKTARNTILLRSTSGHIF